MRAFLAIDIPESIKDGIVKVQKILSKTEIRGKMVERENLHWTVKFLGDITETHAQEIKKLLEDSDILRNPIKVNVVGVGTFPPIEANRWPNIIWAGTSSEQFVALMSQIDRELTKLKIKAEPKKPIPHITTIRVKEVRNIELLQRTISDLEGMQLGEMTISSLTLYRSDLTPRGPVYKKIWTIRWGEDESKKSDSDLSH